MRRRATRSHNDEIRALIERMGVKYCFILCDGKRLVSHEVDPAQKGSSIPNVAEYA